MRYVCLVYLEEATHVAMAGDEDDVNVEEMLDYREELRQSGHSVDAASLPSVRMATTIRVRSGKLSIAEGPFAETKDHLRGFYLIDATDLNEAIRVASNIPAARLGCIEIRPLKECQDTALHWDRHPCGDAG